MLENIMVWDVLWKWIQFRDINEFKDINNTSLFSPINYYFIKGGLVRGIFRIMYGNGLFNISTHQSLPLYDHNKTLVHKILTVKTVVGCKG